MDHAHGLVSPAASITIIIRRADDSLVRQERRDQPRRRDIERGVVCLDAFRGGATAESLGDLARIALFDDDRAAVRRAGIDRGGGGGDVERYAVRVCENGEA